LWSIILILIIRVLIRIISSTPSSVAPIIVVVLFLLVIHKLSNESYLLKEKSGKNEEKIYKVL